MKAIQEVRLSNPFFRYLGSFASEQRFQPFLEIIPRLTDEEYWWLLRDVWTGEEEVMPQMPNWLRLFESKRPGREHLMTDPERASLDTMPDVIQLWRGCGHDSAVRGMSWTTDKKMAKFFAGYACGPRRHYLTGRNDRTHIIVEATCRKIDVLAYITERQESEIVVNPNYVAVQRSYADTTQILNLVKKVTKFQNNHN